MFLWDPYLEALRNEPSRRQYIIAAGFDVLVFGLGAWPASFGQWSMGKFHMAMRQVAATLVKLERARDEEEEEEAARSGAPPPSAPPLPFLSIWAGSPAWPKPRKMPGFRITNYRLGVFNTIGEQVLLLHRDEEDPQYSHRRRSHNHAKTPTGNSSNNSKRLRLDWYQPSFPMLHLHRGDGMHYDGSVVLYSAANLLANLVCN
jgi:hypothetical protein